jgi:hypothetical protein
MGRLLQLLLISALGTLSMLTITFAAVKQVPYNNDRGFSLIIPENWEVNESDAGAVVTFTAPAETGYRPNEQLRLENLTREQNIGEYAQAVHAQLRTDLKELKFLRSGRQTISHTGAKWWVITFREKDVQLKGILFVVIKDKKAFTILGAAPIELYPRYRDTIANIGGSLIIY